jgi:ParB family transcriptional regulator, chromosome partitioning protein
MTSGPKRPTGLGRGLSALLGDIAPATGVAAVYSPDSARSGSQTLPIETIVPSAVQPRRRFDEGQLRELTESIRERGVLQPLLVRPHPVDVGLYEIVAGERRWRASQAIPLHELPVIIRDLSDSETLEIALIENIQRSDLNPVEEADGYRRLIQEFGRTQEEIGQAVGKSRSHVANLIRLLDLPDGTRALLIEGKLSMGHARALLGTTDPDSLARLVVAKGLSVRQAEALAAGKKSAGRPSGALSRKVKDADTEQLERDLSAAIGLAVAIEHGNGSGSVRIAYTNLDELDDLCQRLCAPRRG